MSNIHTIGDIENNQRPNRFNDGSENFTYEKIWPKLSKIYFPKFSLLTFNFIIVMAQVAMFCVSLIVANFVGDKNVFQINDDSLAINIDALILLGGDYLIKIREGQIFRLVTNAFLHSNFSHIIFNVFFQLNLGFGFEQDWGHWRIAFAFFVGAWGSSAFSNVVDPSLNVSVGASGALFAYFGFAITFLVFNWQNLPNRMPRVITLTMIILFSVLFSLSVKNINHFAHLGGFLTGLLIGLSIEPNFFHFGNAKVWIRSIGSVLLILFVVGLTVGIYVPVIKGDK